METPTITSEFDKAKLEHQEILKEIYNLIQHNVEACEFVVLYGDYVENIDDIIDEPFDPFRVLKTFNLAACLFSHPFWIKHHEALFLIDCTINNQYADSLEWEKSETEWKKADAKCLSHCGYNMFYAVVCLVAGYDAMRKISNRFRQYSHLKHRQPKH